MNWLAEGKPLTFVRQLEEVAAKWDDQAKRSRTMPCKGRGFGETSPGGLVRLVSDRRWVWRIPVLGTSTDLGLQA